jgi:hypothetical protein
VIAEASLKGRLTGGNRRVARLRTANAGQPNQAIGTAPSKTQRLSTLRKGGLTRCGCPSHAQSYFVGSGALPDEVRVSAGGDSGLPPPRATARDVRLFAPCFPWPPHSHQKLLCNRSKGCIKASSRQVFERLPTRAILHRASYSMFGERAQT